MTKSICKQWLLWLGLSLTFVLAIFFISVSWLPRLLVEPPKYSFIYAIDFSNHDPRSVNIKDVIRDGKFLLQVKKNTSLIPSASKPTYYVFDHKTQRSHPLDYDIQSPQQFTSEKWVDYSELSFNGSIISKDRKSPDGYSVVYSNGGHIKSKVPFIWGAFTESVLSKNGRSFEYRADNSYKRPRFVGWIIPKEQWL